MPNADRTLLSTAYAAYNEQDLEVLLAFVSADVDWPDGSVAVRIDQAVRSLDGVLVTTGSFCHVHRIKGGLIVRMDIEEVEREPGG